MRTQCPLPPGSRIWIYCRDSGGDEQDRSVDQQILELEAYAHEHSLIILRKLLDRARPGSSTVGRDEFEEMIHLSRQEPRMADGILLWSMSRFARDFDDAQFYKADLRHRGWEIVSISDSIPADGKVGRIIETVIDWKNDQFLEDLSRDVKRGLHSLAKQGYAPGGFPPRGYLAERVVIGKKRNGELRVVSRWVPDPELWPKVKKAWEMRAQGETFREIHAETGLYSSKSCYASMFKNRTYLGILKCGDTEIEGALEAAVTPELWRAVQAQRIARPGRKERWPEDRPHPRRVGSRYLLSGLVYCEYCGAAMTGGTDSAHSIRQKPWPYYVCGRKKRQPWNSCEGRKMNARVIEQNVVRKLLDQVLTPEYIMQLTEEVNAMLSRDHQAVDDKIAAAERDLQGVERAIQNLLDLAEKSGSTAATARLGQREVERDSLRETIAKLKSQSHAPRVQITEVKIKAELHEMWTVIEGDDLQAKRSVLKCFVKRIEVGEQKGKLIYSFPLAGTVLQSVPPRGFEPRFEP